MKKRIVFIAALLCGMCFTTASAQFKIGGKKINVGKVVQAGSCLLYTSDAADE
mgnify:CR=1 FL=1